MTVKKSPVESRTKQEVGIVPVLLPGLVYRKAIGMNIDIKTGLKITLHSEAGLFATR